MINVHIVQVSTKEPEEMARLRRDVAEGYTGTAGRSAKEAKAGDLVIWYVSGRPEVGGQAYTAWGYAGSERPHHVAKGERFGPYQGPVYGLQWFPEPVDARGIKDRIGVYGGHRIGAQYVPPDKVIPFLQALQLLPH
jgi:hypothetical protein